MTERYLDANAVKRLLDGEGESAVVVLPKEGDLIAEKYRVRGILGAGGVATVLEAHHELLDKNVALKILTPDASHKALFPSLSEKFLVEARAAAKVDSPYVARVMDVGTLDRGSAPFIVMERLEGCNLDELLFLEQRPKIDDAVDYVLQALQGLAHAHALGVVHRDLKPANLFLAKQPDGTSTVKILDFGIAFVLDDAGHPPVSMRAARGSIVGSPMYMSPEQLRNDGAIDHRTDIWSIGVVLYELVTGKVPFGASAQGMGELFGAILHDALVPASKVREDSPKGLDAVLAKALTRDVEQRYADVAELATDLVPFGTGKWSHLADSIAESVKKRALAISGPDAFVPEREPQPEREATEEPGRGWILFVMMLVMTAVGVWLAHRAHWF